MYSITNMQCFLGRLRQAVTIMFKPVRSVPLQYARVMLRQLQPQTL